MRISRLVLAAGLIVSSAFVCARPVGAAEITTLDFNLPGWAQPTNASIGTNVNIDNSGFTSSNPNIDLSATSSQYGTWYEEGATDYQPASSYVDGKTYRYRLNLEGVKAINGDSFPLSGAGVTIKLNGGKLHT